jgi:L-amino acid N-acyltransferase YncA
MSVNIRNANLADLKQIVTIHNQAITAFAIGYTEPFKEAERQQWLLSHSPHRPIIVAELDGEVAAWANLADYRSGRNAFRTTAEISYHVHNNYHRQGIASTLVSHLINLCPQLEIHTLLAIILKSNKASTTLLEKLDFKKWAELPDVAELNNQKISHLYYGRQIASTKSN